MSGRLTQLAEELQGLGAGAEAAVLSGLQSLSDVVQGPPGRREKPVRKQLKSKEKKLFRALEAVVNTLKVARRDVAKRVEELSDTLQFEAAMRDEAWMGKELLDVWDKNENGVWEPKEINAYREEVIRLRALAERDADVSEWYFMTEDSVFGPWPLKRVTREREVPPWLVRYGRATGWVRVSDVMD